MKRYTNEMLKYSRSDAEQYKSQEHFWIYFVNTLVYWTTWWLPVGNCHFLSFFIAYLLSALFAFF